MTFDIKKFITENVSTQHKRVIAEAAKYWEVTATGNKESDTRWDSLTARRKGKGGLGWQMTSIIQASDRQEAEKIFRDQPRFRRIARQNENDWRTVDIYISPTTRKDFH